MTSLVATTLETSSENYGRRLRRYSTHSWILRVFERHFFVFQSSNWNERFNSPAEWRIYYGLVGLRASSPNWNGCFFLRRNTLVYHRFSVFFLNSWFVWTLTWNRKQPTKFKKVVSFGGNQSNHMLAVAQLAHDFNLDFEYYSPPVSDRLRKSPSGNYKVTQHISCSRWCEQASLDLGTKFVEDNRNPEAMYVARPLTN